MLLLKHGCIYCCIIPQARCLQYSSEHVVLRESLGNSSCMWYPYCCHTFDEADRRVEATAVADLCRHFVQASRSCFPGGVGKTDPNIFGDKTKVASPSLSGIYPSDGQCSRSDDSMLSVGALRSCSSRKEQIS